MGQIQSGVKNGDCAVFAGISEFFADKVASDCRNAAGSSVYRFGKTVKLGDKSVFDAVGLFDCL